MKDQFHDIDFRSYLLGQLSRQEKEEFDRKLSELEGFENALKDAEQELTEDYANAKLSNDEIRLFEKNFPDSDEREEPLESVVGLKRGGIDLDHSDFQGVQDSHQKRGFFQRQKTTYWSPINFVVLVIIGFVFVSVMWVLLSNSETETAQLESGYQKLNKSDFSDPGKFKRYSSVKLSGHSLQGADGPKILVKAELSKRVLFRLVLPGKPAGGVFYRVELIRNNEAVFTLRYISAYPTESGGELRFLLPSEILDKGTHRIRAFGEDQRIKRSHFTFSIN